MAAKSSSQSAPVVYSIERPDGEGFGPRVKSETTHRPRTERETSTMARMVTVMEATSKRAFPSSSHLFLWDSNHIAKHDQGRKQPEEAE